MEHAVDGSPGDTVSAGQLPEAVSTLAVQDDGGAIELERPATDARAFQSGAAHAGANPFDDQASLQFSDYSDDGHDSAAERAAGVELLAKRQELDPKMIPFVQDLEEVFHRPGDSVALQTFALRPSKFGKCAMLSLRMGRRGSTRNGKCAVVHRHADDQPLVRTRRPVPWQSATAQRLLMN